MRPTLPARLVATAVAMLVLVGCSGSGSARSAEEPTTLGSGEGTEACDDTALAAEASIVPTGRRVVPAYLSIVTLPPGGGMSSSDDVLYYGGPASVGVRVDDPAEGSGRRVTEALRTRLLGSEGAKLGPTGRVAGFVRRDVELTNQTRVDNTYVLFAPAPLVTGTWSAGVCGADGTVVERTGTYRTLGRPQDVRVHPCVGRSQASAAVAAVLDLRAGCDRRG